MFKKYPLVLREAHLKHTRAEHLWKLRCSNSARSLGARHISAHWCEAVNSIYTQPSIFEGYLAELSHFLMLATSQIKTFCRIVSFLVLLPLTLRKSCSFISFLTSSVASVCYSWLTKTNLSYRFPLVQTSACTGNVRWTARRYPREKAKDMKKNVIVGLTQPEVIDLRVSFFALSVCFLF